MQAPALPAWLQRQLPWERYCVEVDTDGGRTKDGGRLRMHVMEAFPDSDASGPRRTILMMHGNPTWGYLYRRIITALDGTHTRIVVPDLIGLGLSSRLRDPNRNHTLENHARWLGRLIDQLDLGELIFMGQDWGGPVGFRALAERPGQAVGLVVLNTVIGPPRAGFKSNAFHRISRLPILSDALFRVLGLPERLLGLAQGDRSSIAGSVARAYRYPLRGLKGGAAPLALARMVPDSMQHPSIAPLAICQAFVESFDGPSAIVWGTRDPVLGRLQRRVSRALPDAELIVTRAGHFLQEEVPGAIAGAARRVIAELDTT